MRRIGIAVGLCASTALPLDRAMAQDAAERRLDAAALMVPIHTRPADPELGEYGTWAVGPDYKVSFHDGFVFYPRLGRDYPENRPLAWVTERSTVGTTDLIDGGAPEHRRSEWRYEYRYPGLVEAYDVREDGVEQTFTLSRHPGGTADWVVTGRLVTSLVADRFEGHGTLTFRDQEGHELIRYGQAVAVDAAGDRAPVSTRFDGERVHLTVDGAWLEQASLPVVLDPLTSARSIISEASPIGDIEVGHDAEAGSTFDHMIVYTVWYSRTDPDVFGRLTASLSGNGPVVFSDVSSTWMSEKPSVAFVGGADRWVIAFQRNSASNTFSRIWLWVHDKNNTSPGAGSLLLLSHPGGATSRYPDVGGTASDSSGTHALVVYQTDITGNNSNTANTEVWGALVDAAAKTIGRPFRLADVPVGTLFDREQPAVNQQSAGGNASWVTAWQERNYFALLGTWVIHTQRITSTGARAATATISGPGAPDHAVWPCIDGRGGRYMAAYVRTSSPGNSGGTVIEVARFDADENQSQITVQRQNVIGSISMGSLEDPAISYDFLTRSHWAVAYERYVFGGPSSVDVARVGYTGGIVESAVAVSRSTWLNHEPALTFWPEQSLPSRFTFVYADQPILFSSWHLTGRFLEYDPNADSLPYGTGCGGSITARNWPFAGSEFFGVSLTAGPSVPATLLISGAAANLSLTPIGMPGCSLLVDPWVSLPATTGVTGNATIQLALPDQPAFFGDVYFQWVIVAPGNALGLQTTQGLKSQVR